MYFIVFRFFLNRVKSEEIFSLTAVVSLLSFAACWLPLHFYLQLYSIVIDMIVSSPFRSNFLNFAGKYLAKYLLGVFENRDNFPTDAILAFR